MTTWNIGPRAASYKAITGTPEQAHLLKDSSQGVYFSAYSIADGHKQVALIPTDNPTYKADALMILHAPGMMHIINLVSRMIETVALMDATSKEGQTAVTVDLMQIMMLSRTLLAQMQAHPLLRP